MQNQKINHQINLLKINFHNILKGIIGIINIKDKQFSGRINVEIIL
jgi:hypothetical protein